MNTIVLTGQVHIGKTTLCQRVVQWAQERGYGVRGFVTLTILDEHGARLALEIRDLETGACRNLARVDHDWGGPSVGPFHFDPQILKWAEELVIRASNVGCDLLIVDEIGRLELEQGEGFQRILSLLPTTKVPRCLLVVRSSLLEAFLRRIPTLAPLCVEVREDNRDTLLEPLIVELYRTCPSHCQSSHHLV